VNLRAASSVFLAVAIGLALAGCTNRTETTQSAKTQPKATGAPAAPVVRATASAGPIDIQPTTVFETTASAPASAPTTIMPDPIVRPSVAVERCSPRLARDGTMATADLQLFTRRVKSAFPVQVIGSASLGPIGAFAVVQRLPVRADRPEGGDEINGWNVAVEVFNNGNGQASWRVGDGTEGYLRSRGMNRDELVRIVTSLRVRDASAAVPGFDYVDDQTSSTRLLVDQMNTAVRGRVSFSECTVLGSGYIYQLFAIEGDDLAKFAAIIDQSPPLEVGYRDGTLISIGGVADPAAPTVRDVVNADPGVWGQLLAAPSEFGPG
jgi:hypothetical protein